MTKQTFRKMSCIRNTSAAAHRVINFREPLLYNRGLRNHVKVFKGGEEGLRGVCSYTAAIVFVPPPPPPHVTSYRQSQVS